LPPAPEQHALIWRRTDFSETSRLVILITRSEGKVSALAKGAHRAASPFLGRLDHLNLVLPRYARRRGPGLRLLRDVRLLCEHRGLRQPRRFLAAHYLCEIFDAALLEGRSDPPLFDLLVGALHALDRCPPQSLPTFVVGLELRLLRVLGMLPDLNVCSACGRPSTPLYTAPQGHGLACARHKSGAALPIPATALAWLRSVENTPGRHWDDLPRPGPASRTILGKWVATAIERPLRWRAHALDGC